jgi:hypothetical protein
MKIGLLFLFAITFTQGAFAQNFTGQWKGEFTDNSTSFVGWGGDRCEYVVELESNGKTITGYSYTYFSEAGKRYYTICRLQGKINKASRFVEVTEVERTKTNVPNNIRNCFQIHKLTYYKQDNEETLEGTWVPAPNQEGDCGYGTTSLSRRMLKKNTAIFNNVKPRTETKPIVKATTPSPLKNKKITPPIVKNNTPQKTVVSPPIVRSNPPGDEKNKSENPPITKIDAPEKKYVDNSFEKRNSNLIKTIEIDNESFRVDLYDNGEIDGDSISLFYNGKLLLSHKRLSDRAISLTLKVENIKDVNELVMYADNLGEIPPNTALMVVTDGDSRYEVRISSDLKKSGTIRFVHKEKMGQ